jgi:hypothetical protein
MLTKEQIQSAYIDYVLTHNATPASVYIFAKQLGAAEEEFYQFYASFTAIEKDIWSDLVIRTIDRVQQQEQWPGYSSREKMLSFFYAFTELLKSKRSFVVYSLQQKNMRFATPAVLSEARKLFETFAESLVREGLDTKELADRKFFSKRYKDALWVQFAFIVNFWIHDNSNGFEKTDEAIERGINVTFDLFQQSPLDNIFEYGKFMARNTNLKEALRF